MNELVITEQNLNRIVKNIVESAQESLIYILVDTLENEGSHTMVQNLLDMKKACQTGGFSYKFDEYIRYIVSDCFEQYGPARSQEEEPADSQDMMQDSGGGEGREMLILQ